MDKIPSRDVLPSRIGVLPYNVQCLYRCDRTRSLDFSSLLYILGIPIRTGTNADATDIAYGQKYLEPESFFVFLICLFLIIFLICPTVEGHRQFSAHVYASEQDRVTAPTLP